MMHPFALVLLLMTPLLAAAAGANPAVFARSSDVPVNPNAPLELAEGSSNELVHLFVEFGTTGSPGGATPCTEDSLATGDEVCGFDVEVEVTGDLAIVGFAPETGTVYQPSPPLTGVTLLRIVGVMATSFVDPDTAAQKIGVLSVDTTGANGGTVNLRSGQAVRADLEMMSLSADVVASTDLPEPGALLGLGSGLAVLLGLHRRRQHARRRA